MLRFFVCVCFFKSKPMGNVAQVCQQKVVLEGFARPVCLVIPVFSSYSTIVIITIFNGLGVSTREYVAN